MPNASTSRGGGWVVGQFIILAVILIVGYFDPWRTTTSSITPIIGAGLGVIAVIMLVMAFFHLGQNLTAFPKPLANGALVTHGMYALVRHPIYVGVITSVVAYSIFQGSWLSGFGSAVLAVWFDRKAAREEAFLSDTFADYTVYAQKVAKFIPGLY